MSISQKFWEVGVGYFTSDSATLIYMLNKVNSNVNCETSLLCSA